MKLSGNEKIGIVLVVLIFGYFVFLSPWQQTTVFVDNTPPAIIDSYPTGEVPVETEYVYATFQDYGEMKLVKFMFDGNDVTAMASAINYRIPIASLMSIPAPIVGPIAPGPELPDEPEEPVEAPPLYACDVSYGLALTEGEHDYEISVSDQAGNVATASGSFEAWVVEIDGISQIFREDGSEVGHGQWVSGKILIVFTPTEGALSMEKAEVHVDNAFVSEMEKSVERGRYEYQLDTTGYSDGLHPVKVIVTSKLTGGEDPAYDGVVTFSVIDFFTGEEPVTQELIIYSAIALFFGVVAIWFLRRKRQAKAFRYMPV